MTQRISKIKSRLKELHQQFPVHMNLVITIDSEHKWSTDLTIPIDLVLFMHQINGEMIINPR